MNEILIDEAIGVLTKLKIKAEMEDRARGKVRYVKKTRAYQDLIDLLKQIVRSLNFLYFRKFSFRIIYNMSQHISPSKYMVASSKHYFLIS